jgi:adenine-specific DNA-methyltransferase
MSKFRFETSDIAEGSIEKIGEMFPSVITEALDEERSTASKKVYKKAVNFELLKQMLSGDIMGGDEAYEFTWVGKKASIVEANKPIRKTLRPCKEESIDWDTTENLYIEGDNLDVLKLLQESYLGKVKMIYIDPPYNTGNDFVYRDDFTKSKEEYEEEAGVYDEDGDRLFHNTRSNGRFHSDWCSMIYPRLVMARNLLRDDGAIFISIDDNEAENLKKICNEVFGESNFMGWIVWQHSIQPKGYLGTMSVHHNHIFLYQKSPKYVLGALERTEEDNKAYGNPDNDPNGPWRSGDVRNALYRPNLIYDIISPSGKIIKPCDNGWRWSKETVEEKIKTGEIIFSDDETRIIRKIYLKNLEGRTPETIWFAKDVGSTRDAMGELKKMFRVAPFDTPKPINLIKRMMAIAHDEDSIILDFFSGSATTAHAVMQLNAEDGGHRRFIMVQLPEPCDEQSEAYKAGYKNICEIGKERVRRAGENIKSMIEGTNAQAKIDDGPKPVPDIGFRVLKLDDTNMKEVYYSADKYSQRKLSGLESNIKEDRTNLDLLFGCLLDWGLILSMPYTSETMEDCTIHTYNDGDLIACFDANVPENIIREIASRQPLRVVFRDNSFASSPEKINVQEIFKLLAPHTDVRVL